MNCYLLPLTFLIKKKKKVMLPTITKGRGSNRLIKIIRCNRLTVRGIDLCETA